MHKNTSFKNKHLFINNFKEILGKNSKGDPEKIMFVVEGLDILEYSNFCCYMKFNAQIKFTKHLKIKQLVCSILELEIRDDEKKFNVSLVNNPFYHLFQTFKSFLSNLQSLILDMNFLNDFF